MNTPGFTAECSIGFRKMFAASHPFRRTAQLNGRVSPTLLGPGTDCNFICDDSECVFMCEGSIGGGGGGGRSCKVGCGPCLLINGKYQKACQYPQWHSLHILRLYRGSDVSETKRTYEVTKRYGCSRPHLADYRQCQRRPRLPAVNFVALRYPRIYVADDWPVPCFLPPLWVHGPPQLTLTTESDFEEGNHTMNMPGFTAESSLTRLRGRFGFERSFAQPDEGAITPQRIKVKTVYCDCDSDGYCECDDGTALNDWTGMLELHF